MFGLNAIQLLLGRKIDLYDRVDILQLLSGLGTQVGQVRQTREVRPVRQTIEELTYACQVVGA
jgi:hypothetical protein